MSTFQAVGVRGTSTLSQPNIPHLTVVDLPGGGFTDIPLDVEGASGNEFGGSVQWSPDGTRFAYTAQSFATGLYEVRVCNRDGSGITTILPSSDPPGGPIWDQWAVYDWWPDGSALLISWTDEFVASGAGAGKIMKCDPDGSNVQTLYDDPAGALIGRGNNNYLALSPDGSQIAAVCADGTLRVMPSGGGALTTIYSDATFPPSLFLGCVAWRRGPKIVFMTLGASLLRIYTVNGDGSGLDMISEGAWFSAVWASDTQLLVVENGATEQLYLMNLDGTNSLVPDSSQYWGGVKMSVIPAPLVVPPGAMAAGAPDTGIVRRGSLNAYA